MKYAETYVVLLRGVNVAGKNKLPMASLREELSNDGLTAVRTYIQSGNIICAAPISPSELHAQISSLLVSKFSIQTPVFTMTTSVFRAILVSNPFADRPCDKALHLFFLSQPAVKADIEKLDALKAASEAFVVADDCFYLYAPDGIGRSRLAAGVKKGLGVTTTARNWRTVNAILKMLE